LYYVYVLKNSLTGRTYTGVTSDLRRRLEEHNRKPASSRKYTQRKTGSWVLVYVEEFAEKREAYKREKFLKTGSGRKFLKEILSKKA
jgi:putative endonuclease